LIFKRQKTIDKSSHSFFSQCHILNPVGFIFKEIPIIPLEEMVNSADKIKGKK
jgi:hypothetical protein